MGEATREAPVRAEPHPTSPEPHPTSPGITLTRAKKCAFSKT